MTVPVQIRKSQVAERIREAAALTGQSITDVVDEGIGLVLDRAYRRLSVDERRRNIDRILAEVRELPRLGPVPTDDDFYDEDGLPK
jgi:hypothetical protein